MKYCISVWETTILLGDCKGLREVVSAFKGRARGKTEPQPQNNVNPLGLDNRFADFDSALAL